MSIVPVVIIITAIAVFGAVVMTVFGIGAPGNNQVPQVVVIVQQPEPSGWGRIFIAVIFVSVLIAIMMYAVIVA